MMQNNQQKAIKAALKPKIFALFLPEIRQLVATKDFAQLKSLLRGVHSTDLTKGWEDFVDQEKIIVFRLLSSKKAVEVFEDLKFHDQSFLLGNLDNAEIASVLNEMAPDERADLFKDLRPRVIRKLFSLMKKEEVDDVRTLLEFEEDTAASLMTTEFVELKREMTARRAIIHLQEKQKSTGAKNIYTVYVTDDSHCLVGGVNLQEIIAAPSDMLVKDIMTDVSSVKLDVNCPKEDVGQLFEKYDLLDSPVVNEQNQLMGVITIDDVVDLIQRDATRDMYEIGKMGAKGGEEINYDRATVGELIKRRAGWLMFLLCFDFLTGTVLKTFEHALSTVVALVFFIPMLLDTGGNAGNQTAITIIRGMATGDVNFKNVWKVAKLEIKTALLMSLIVGVVAFIRAVLLQKDVFVSVVVGITMSVIVILAILTGVCLPILSKRVGLDPAALAGPITTSIVDVVGLIIYFKIAQFFIPILQ